MFKYFFKILIASFIIVCLLSIFSAYILKQNKETFESEGFASSSIPKLSDILNELDQSVINTDEDFITQSDEIENVTKKFLTTLGTFKKKVIAYMKKKGTKLFSDNNELKEVILEETTEETTEESNSFVNEEKSEDVNEKESENVETFIDQIDGFVCDSAANCEEYN
tara:strand:- start:25142 stop:25642 length:501 start_codon:yes stop_codon:yes gene_type:complete